MHRRALSALMILFSLVLPVAAQSPVSSGPPQSPPTGAEKPKPKLKLPDEDPTAATKPKQDPQQEFALKLDTALVNVPVLVYDRDGKYIAGLQRGDFAIYEDGVKQEIDSFSAMDAPFNVALLLDSSNSTRFKFEDIQRAALAFTEQLRAQDRVLIASFDDKIYVDSELTGDRRQMRQAILNTRTGQATRLYDALDLVLLEKLKTLAGRKAIVLFTDGVDTASRLASALSVLELVEESNVLVYVVQYDTREDVISNSVGIIANRNGQVLAQHQLQVRGATEQQYARGDNFLHEAADRSGARLYQAQTLKDVDQAFAQIAEELRQQYALSYYPANDKRDGTYRKIKVVVAKPAVALRARKGYRAASEAK